MPLRVGAFGPMDFQFGIPVAVAKPADNQFPIYDADLVALGLSNADLQELYNRANEVYQTLKAARDFSK